MLALKLAFKNLLGAGLRTWLNVVVLSFAFVLMVFYNGMIDGWNRQGKEDTRQWEIGGGQYWHPQYDRYDPYSLTDAHAPLSGQVQQRIEQGDLTPVLMVAGAAYPHGHMLSVLLQGVDPAQRLLKLPVEVLHNPDNAYVTVLGRRMASAMQLAVGDKVLVRWRDRRGTFDAREITVAAIFNCDVPSVDNGKMYMNLAHLQRMTGLHNEATLLVSRQGSVPEVLEPWRYQDEDFLLAELDKIIQSKRVGGVIMEGLLLIMALLAVFDTQVLSVFRRQKEIGTYIALGMTRRQVVGIFTVEGAAHSILAAILGALYGIPLFIWLNSTGITFGTPDMGITMAATIYPYYSIQLIVITLLLVVLSATVVSYIPARRIARMRPTDALKGKLQ